MRRFQSIVLSTIFGLSLVGLARADTLSLRTDCGSPAAAGCYTTLDDVLQALHHPTFPRALPSATNPVLVDIGPGIFSLTSLANKYCDHVSNLSFRGAGKENTILTGGGFPAQNGLTGSSYAAWFDNCSAVSVQGLTIRADSTIREGFPQVWSGVNFEGNGTVRWRDVRITAAGYAYYDENSTSRSTSVHFWYDSELVAEAPGPVPTFYTAALYTVGATHWVHGSQLVASAQSNVAFALVGAGEFDIHVYGSRITASGVAANSIFMSTDISHTPPRNQCAVSKLSVEGSAIDANSPNQAVTLAVANCGKAAIRGTRFDATAPLAKRVSSNPNLAVDAPYDYGSGTEPPSFVTNIPWNTTDGQDTFVETDCSSPPSPAKCDGGAPLGDKHHLLSFRASCNTAGPWFDTFTQKCRGDL